MSNLELVAQEAYDLHRSVMLVENEVWLTMSTPWWDLASWVWWWLTPGRTRWLIVRGESGRARVRAKRIAKRHFRKGASE